MQVYHNQTTSHHHTRTDHTVELDMDFITDMLYMRQYRDISTDGHPLARQEGPVMVDSISAVIDNATQHLVQNSNSASMRQAVHNLERIKLSLEQRIADINLSIIQNEEAEVMAKLDQ